MKELDIVINLCNNMKGMIIDVENNIITVEFWDKDRVTGEKYFWTEKFVEEELELVY